ncbi:mRNA interferase RelE/StbE [Actinopolymorpha cephalotaxi]|uniref:mRNA interferase RelE/StbE n=1 Tax=Actinopolymorpha cephalotaxi TaxID=504797 RepID=A0A1I3CDZ4_9ACTN|nr:type II toxin-antitoxin system RelE/ParE family toxin [Actinopolymorpha cephalotaxi]NYH83794.1 mRNA interferase RelE/StbE [Actinopolymorpha cephalotaxi]SFH72449.1 mRNA interferase RelE/StbE [Actinopolymorpha cephalotaxi]
MSYQIQVEPAAVRALRRLRKGDQLAWKRVAVAIDELAAEPRPHGAKALQGRSGLLRIRVGDYRVIYEVQDAQLVVLVVDLGHRRDIYR